MGSRHFLDFGSLENNEHSKCEWVHEVIWIHGDHVYACMFIFVSVGVHLVEHDMEFFFKISKSIICSVPISSMQTASTMVYVASLQCRLRWIDSSIPLNKQVTIMIRYWGSGMVIMKWPAVAVEHEVKIDSHLGGIDI